MAFDKTDLRILKEIVRSPRDSFREIAKKLGMHTATVIRRYRAMEEKGIVKGMCIKLDFEKLGYEVVAWFLLSIDLKKKKKVLRVIEKDPRIIKAYEITGSFDLALQGVVRNVKEFGRLIDAIANIDGVKRVETSIVLNKTKDYCFFEDGIID